MQQSQDAVWLSPETFILFFLPSDQEVNQSVSLLHVVFEWLTKCNWAWEEMHGQPSIVCLLRVHACVCQVCSICAFIWVFVQGIRVNSELTQCCGKWGEKTLRTEGQVFFFFFFYGYMHRLIQQAPAVCVVDSPLGSFAIDQGFGLSFSFAAFQKS